MLDRIFEKFEASELAAQFMDAIKNWFIDNGTTLNVVYGAVLLFVLLSFFMSSRMPSESENEKDHSDSMGTGLYIYGSILAIPSVLLYAFDGMTEKDELLRFAPISFSELMWFHKIILIAFGILFLMFFLTIFCIDRNFVLFWNTMAMNGVIVLLCIAFMLLERGLKALFPNSGILSFTLMIVHVIVQFYSYIALIAAPVMVILSPFLMLIPGIKNASAYNVSTAEQEHADSLDAQERALNSLTGVGYLTNDQAFIAGKIDANEWAAGSILRDNKMDRVRKK